MLVLGLTNCRISQLLSRSSADATLRVSPVAVRDSALAGSTAPRRASLEITNSGSWRATYDSPWIRVNPASGHSRDMVTVSLDPGDLPPGTHEGTVTIRAPDAAGSPATVPVTFVIQQPVLKVTPAEVTFTTRSSNGVFRDTVRITNEGNGPLFWTATTAIRSAWLTLGTVAGGAPGEIPLTLSSSGLVLGTFKDTLIVTAPGAVGSPATVVVTLRRRRD